MIPKKIHYCWFGGNPIPEKDKKCIDSWREFCPDYEIIEWNESNYDVSKNVYMKEAYDAKKWGFVPDYARLDIIYQHGGVYLDTDVEIIKSFDEFLENRAFMGFEDGAYVSPGLCIGAVPHHKAIGELMKIYQDRKFVMEDGSFDLTPSPQMNTEWLLQRGLKQDNSLQVIADMKIYPTEYFCPLNYRTRELFTTTNTYAIHWFNASWQTPLKRKITYIEGRLSEKGIMLKMLGKIYTLPLRIINKYQQEGFKGIMKTVRKKCMSVWGGVIPAYKYYVSASILEGGSA